MVVYAGDYWLSMINQWLSIIDLQWLTTYNKHKSITKNLVDVPASARLAQDDSKLPNAASEGAAGVAEAVSRGVLIREWLPILSWWWVLSFKPLENVGSLQQSTELVSHGW